MMYIAKGNLKINYGEFYEKCNLLGFTKTWFIRMLLGNNINMNIFGNLISFVSDGSIRCFMLLFNKRLSRQIFHPFQKFAIGIFTNF